MRRLLSIVAAGLLAACTQTPGSAVVSTTSCQTNAAGQPASASEVSLCQGVASFQAGATKVADKVAAGAAVVQKDAKLVCGYLPWVKGLFDIAVLGAQIAGSPIDPTITTDAGLASTIGTSACNVADKVSGAVATGTLNAQTVQTVAGAVKDIKADLKQIAPGVAAAASNPASATNPGAPTLVVKPPAPVIVAPPTS